MSKSIVFSLLSTLLVLGVLAFLATRDGVASNDPVVRLIDTDVQKLKLLQDRLEHSIETTSED